MSLIPRDRSIDGSLAMLADGYEYISKRCDRYGGDIFAVRLLLDRPSAYEAGWWA